MTNEMPTIRAAVEEPEPVSVVRILIPRDWVDGVMGEVVAAWWRRRPGMPPVAWTVDPDDVVTVLTCERDQARAEVAAKQEQIAALEIVRDGLQLAVASIEAERKALEVANRVLKSAGRADE
jgi:hypothetical protein